MSPLMLPQPFYYNFYAKLTCNLFLHRCYFLSSLFCTGAMDSVYFAVCINNNLCPWLVPSSTPPARLKPASQSWPLSLIFHVHSIQSLTLFASLVFINNTIIGRSSYSFSHFSFFLFLPRSLSSISALEIWYIDIDESVSVVIVTSCRVCF